VLLMLVVAVEALINQGQKELVVLAVAVMVA
jgi:hypothetical protein